MKEFVYNNKPKELCYGCRACEQICSHNAIVMEKNEEGFIYPKIDQAKCTECGMCEKVCPTQDINKNKILNVTPKKCLAAWNQNIEERLQSTSGGIFYLLARRFIEQGGIVYGSAMNSELIAQHVRVTSIIELQHLRGSKYMQSNTLNTFLEVKTDLKRGLLVLYSGTPCQIAGLRSFLMKNYDNLYTVDLVCHGTPSPQIFKEHLNFLARKYGSKVTSFHFRAKMKDEWSPCIICHFENGLVLKEKPGEDFYAQCFYSSTLNRKSCYLCEYSQCKRVGDVTLSDFWGSEMYNKRLKKIRKHGYNLVMCNTEKGNSLIHQIAHQLESVEMETTIAINGDIRLRIATEEPSLRQKIYSDYSKYGYEHILVVYSKKISLFKRCCPAFVINIIKEIRSHL